MVKMVFERQKALPAYVIWLSKNEYLFPEGFLPTLR